MKFSFSPGGGGGERGGGRTELQPPSMSSQERARPRTLIPASFVRFSLPASVKHAMYGTDLTESQAEETTISDG
jgi:hypothetical protein